MVYELEITLRHIEPRVWRLFTVPATITLEQLHEAIIIVMGWRGGHLWNFDINGTQYGSPNALQDDIGPEADSVIAGCHLPDGQSF